MATALFINRTDLVRNSILDGNVDTDKFIQFIKIAQEIDIQNYTGTDLYNKISTLIANGEIDDVANAKYKTLLNTFTTNVNMGSTNLLHTFCSLFN